MKHAGNKWGQLTDHNGVVRKLGYLPDLEDGRDKYYMRAMVMSPAQIKTLPVLVDLEGVFPRTRDQSTLGACTGFGWAGVREYMEVLDALGMTPDFVKENWNEDGTCLEVPIEVIAEIQRRSVESPDFMKIFSPLWIYWQERYIEGNLDYDVGAFIRTGAKVLARLGTALEKDHDYDVRRFVEPPSPEANVTAQEYQIIKYQRVRSRLLEMKRVLADGNPIVGGWSIYESFYEAGKGEEAIIRMPDSDESCLGGHCMVIVGYSDEKNCFRIRNSWGSDWGDHGYAWMDYAYAEKFGSDFWICTRWE